MSSKTNLKNKFNVEETINILLNKGSQIACDETTVDLKIADNLPDWYDEDKFKRGQKFFRDNIFVMFFAKLCGLLTLLAIPSILNILVMTKMSNTPLAAYRRYMATIFHMNIWYYKDFKPGSQLWESIKDVRNKHFSASKKAEKMQLARISQADMVLTQFGFMGYAILHPKLVGLHHATEKDLQGFIHVWRVVGHLLGIQDRFNLCQGSIEETREYCRELVEKCFVPNLLNAPNDFKHMAKTLIEGMLVFQPCLDFGVYMTYIYQMCNLSITENNNLTELFPVNRRYKFLLYFTRQNMYLYQYYIFRLLHNTILYLSFYIIRYFPFLAFIKFGFRDSYLPPLLKRTNTTS